MATTRGENKRRGWSSMGKRSAYFSPSECTTGREGGAERRKPWRATRENRAVCTPRPSPSFCPPASALAAPFSSTVFAPSQPAYTATRGVSQHHRVKRRTPSGAAQSARGSKSARDPRSRPSLTTKHSWLSFFSFFGLGLVDGEALIASTSKMLCTDEPTHTHRHTYT